MEEPPSKGTLRPAEASATKPPTAMPCHAMPCHTAWCHRAGMAWHGMALGAVAGQVRPGTTHSLRMLHAAACARGGRPLLGGPCTWPGGWSWAPCTLLWCMAVSMPERGFPGRGGGLPGLLCCWQALLDPRPAGCHADWHGLLMVSDQMIGMACNQHADWRGLLGAHGRGAGAAGVDQPDGCKGDPIRGRCCQGRPTRPCRTPPTPSTSTSTCSWSVGDPRPYPSPLAMSRSPPAHRHLTQAPVANTDQYT